MQPGSLEQALATDLYELRMAEAYVDEGLTGPAVFSLFVRNLPPTRNLLVAAGLDDVLTWLETLRFPPDALAWLGETLHFPDRFLAWLADFRFEGDVRAVPEGTPVFGDEPLLEITAPLPVAQLVETAVMQIAHLQTLLASKAHRVVAAARGRPVVDFGMRRMHGADAALQGARAFHLAGVDATSDVLAGHRYGVPVTGTMAHSYVQAHGDEDAAFAAFAATRPGTTLLVDTWDTLAGVDRVIALARRRKAAFDVGAVRLDSGDLLALSVAARRRLDAAGLTAVKIVASGGLDERSIEALVSAGAPIDVFGVGTALGVSADAPSLDIAYKLVAYDGQPRWKTSTDKATWPCSKQVFRHERDGAATHDVLARSDEDGDGRPLLVPVMTGGQRVAGQGTLDDARARRAAEVARLPTAVRGIGRAAYRVEVSGELRRARGAGKRGR